MRRMSLSPDTPDPAATPAPSSAALPILAGNGARIPHLPRLRPCGDGLRRPRAHRWASPRFEAVVCSATALAGAGQFIALAVLASGAGVAAVLVATTIVNLRYVLFAATLSPYLHGVSTPEAGGNRLHAHRRDLRSQHRRAPARPLLARFDDRRRGSSPGSAGCSVPSRVPGGPTGSETRRASASASRCRPCSSRCSSRSPRTGVTW